MQRRSELRAEAARLEGERQDLGRTRTRAESYALIAAAAVGALSLAFTAWGTYWTAQVAEAQLMQTTEQNEDSRSDQASKVTYWVERPKPLHRGQLVIVNRSQDPVNDVSMHTHVYGLDKDWEAGVTGPEVITMIGTMPPCSEVRIPEMNAAPDDRLPSDRGGYFQSLDFQDSKGTQWHRDEEGVLGRGHHDLWYRGSSLAISEAVPKPFKECGSDK